MGNFKAERLTSGRERSDVALHVLVMQFIMSRLRNIPETCPIYKEAEHLFDCLKGEMEEELSDYLAERFTDYAKNILECVDRCRDISGELREMCVERGEKIEEIEEKLESLIPA